MFLSNTSLSQYLSPPRSIKKVPANCWGNLTDTCGGIDKVPRLGGVEILLHVAASCHRISSSSYKSVSSKASHINNNCFLLIEQEGGLCRRILNEVCTQDQSQDSSVKTN